MLLVLSAGILLATGAGLLIASDAGTESRKLSGKISYSKDRMLLQSGKEKYILATLSPAALDSLGFAPAEGDEVSVQGFMSKGIMVVTNAVWQDKSYAFRDSLYQSTRPETGTWTVNEKACIGCNLCVVFCPAGAITLQNVNGSKKAVIDQSLCLGCNVCIAGNNVKYTGCPTKAISK
jgi:ferredoxin